MSKVSSAAQTGVLIPGPGGVRINAVQNGLVSLTIDQQELVNKARKYALDQSLKILLAKQTLTTQQQQQKSLQRHQALVLMCRVYVGSISFEVREETIKAAFAPYGAIKSINMTWDPVTGKHKGFAFVEYELPEAAQLALEHVNGLQLGNRQIKVGRPSNMPQATPIIEQIQAECKEKNRIYVSNVHPDLSETDLANLFEPFGKVLTCKLALAVSTEKPGHRGYGFVEFETEATAIEALTMDNLDLGGQVLHVCRATTPAENLSCYGTLEHESTSTSSSLFNNSTDDIQLQLESTNKDHTSEILMEPEAVKLEATLLQRDQTLQQQEPKNTTREVMTNGKATSENVSNVIVLRNMVTAEDELDDTLQLDVYEECGKYGQVLQVVIHVDKKPLIKVEDDQARPQTNMDQIKIFVKYNNSQSSQQAREALNGRFFAGRKVSAEFYDRDLFRMNNYSANIEAKAADKE